MAVLHAVIESAESNLSAYIREIDGIVGVGNTLEDVKRSLQESFDLYIDECKKDKIKFHQQLNEENEIIYQFNLCSFLQSYSAMLSKSGLEAITGINQKQLWFYSSGKSKPRKATIDKMSEQIHAFARELEQVEFIQEERHYKKDNI